MDEVSVISRIIKLEVYVGNCFYHTLKKGNNILKKGNNTLKKGNNIFLCLALIPSVYGKTR